MLRKLIRTFVSIIATSLIIPFVQAPASNLAEKIGFDTALSSRWGPLMHFLSNLQRSSIYIFAAGCGVGIACGVWLDMLLKGKEKSLVKDEISYSPTMLRIERDRSVPHQWHAAGKQNVYLFFQIWNAKPTVTIKEYSGSIPTYNINIPELYPNTPNPTITPEQLDTFFIVLDGPIVYSRIRIEAFGHTFPKHDIYAYTNRTAILYLREQIPQSMTTFEIHFDA